MATVYLEEVQQASSSVAFFSTCPDNRAARKRYRLFARHLHPDINGGEQQYTDAFQKLQDFWNAYSAARQANVTPGTAPTQVTVKTKRHEYSFDGPVARFDTQLTAGFTATYDQGHKSALVQVGKSTQDNDLVQNAALKMRQLRREVPKQYHPFFPEFIESFRLTQADGVHNGYAIRPYPKEFFTLAEVKSRYSKGLDGRDIVWILKRLLVAVGNAHERGIIHANIQPHSVLVSPDLHGVILKDWEYSVEKGNNLVAIWPKFETWYSTSVLQKDKAADENLDIRLVANTMLSLSDKSSLPAPLLEFLKRKMVQMKEGPKTASFLITELARAAEESYGPPAYHTFLMN